MYNKKVLIDSLKKLGSAKAPTKKPDIIYEPKGQLKYPGQNTRIPSGDITMQGVPYPVLGKPNIGQPQMMYPDQNYQFPGADYVDEYPQMKKGGRTKGLISMPKPSKKGLMSKKYSRSLDATNKFFTQNYLFAKPKSRKNKVFDPNANYAKGGQSNETQITSKDGVETPIYKKVDIKPSKIHGNGLFTKEAIKKNEPIGICHVKNKDGQLIPSTILGMYNHNKKTPNVYEINKGDHVVMMPLRDISPGEELTADYDMVSIKGLQDSSSFKDGGEQSCPKGYAYNPKTGKCIEWTPTIYKSTAEPTSYNPVADVIYMNPNDRPEGMSDKEYQQMYQDQLEHEQLHRFQWINGELKGYSGTPLRMPSPVDNEEHDGEHYYNRRSEEVDYLQNYWKKDHPAEAEFMPDSLIYDKETNPAMYELPWTVEGEAREYEYNTRDGMPSLFPKKQDGGPTSPEEWVQQIKDIERQIGNPSGWTLSDYNTLQNKLNEYKYWRENTPEGQAVIDSHNEEGEYDIPLPEHLQDYTNAMMKARLAYANEFGNPAAERMINLPDNPYQFDNGDTGTHYMASYDNYAVPQIQDENGVLQLGDYGPESNEAIRFDSDEDANYFAEHYKDVSPGFINEKKEGGASGCPKGYYWNGKKCVKLLTRIYNNREEFNKANQLMQDSIALFKSNAIGLKNLNKKLSDIRKGNFDHGIREIDIWGNNTGRYLNNLEKTNRKNISSSGQLRWPEWNDLTDVNSKFINPNIKPTHRVADKIYTYRHALLNKPFNSPWEKSRLTQNYYDAYRAPNTQPVYQEKNIKDPVKDLVKDPPTTRTVYIDCPPGSVSNDEKTEVITNDPDSPGNYLRTITTGCKPEKIENLPLLKPGLIDPTKDELQGNTLNEEVESEYLEEGSPDTENAMEWVNKRKYDIDWNGIQIPYRLPRFRKPGSYGDLIKPGKQRYINLPKITSRNTAYLREEQDGGLHKFVEGGAEASWPPKGWPPIGNYKGLLGLVKKVPTVNTFGNALKLPAVNWTTPSIPTLKREFNVEQVLKNQNFFPDENSFLNAVKNATVQEITPEIDATIGYRSGTTTKEQLLELSKTYASYPQYRNEGTIDAIFDGLKSGAEMEMPMVLQFPNGNKRVFSGNTRMDASRQLGINPNVLMLNVPDMTKLANPWQREAFPGLQYKSTMLSNPKGLWTQVAKDGTINVENALKVIEKESAGDVKVELLKETLGENIPKKMDFNLFRKKTQETIIPLETTIVDHNSNYGIVKVGYPRENRDFFERALEAHTLDIAEIEKKIKNASSNTRQLNSWDDATEQSPMMNHIPFDRPIYEAMGPNGFGQYFPTLEEAKQQEEITLRTLREQLKNSINSSYSTRKEMHDLPLENKTVIFSNKDLFGVGSDAHSNPPETLAHIHFLRDADFPDILLATQIQSDPFQSKNYWKYNINDETDAIGEKIRRKALNIESRNDYIAQGIGNTNYSKEQWEEKKLSTLEEINELNNEINILKETLEPIVKKYTPNYKQKVLLDKNHKKRFFQEFLNYAANRGDVNYIAIPTVETSARIQNYAALSPNEQPGPESKLLLDNSNSFEEFVKKVEEVKGESFQDATEQDKYLLKKGYELYKKDGTLKELLNDKRNYKSKNGTVLGNYEEYIKIAKKLGLEIEDVIIKGHTYKKIVIPEDFLKGVGEIDAYKKGGATNKSIEINLTPEEIKKYVNGGYVVEEIDNYQDGGITKLTPKEEKQFQNFYKTLPDNLQSDNDTYDIRGYWDSEQRPTEFDYTQPKDKDGFYRAYSINGNTGEYLKSPAHPTFQHSVDEDRKIGYRPITNVQGRNIAIENKSIADPEEQSFLRNTEGPINYIEADYQLGDEVDEDTMKTLKKLGYTFNKI
jgi:hypothetical protein